MTVNVTIDNVGTSAVKELRLKKLSSGHTFMINSKELPAKQCYLEYPDGSIKLVTISGTHRDFVVIKDLLPNESAMLRRKFQLN